MRDEMHCIVQDSMMRRPPSQTRQVTPPHDQPQISGHCEDEDIDTHTGLTVHVAPTLAAQYINTTQRHDAH